MKPRLGGIKLRDLRGTQISAALIALRAERKISAATNRRVLATLHNACTEAVRTGLLTRNPCADVGLARVEQEEPPYWRPEQVGAFLDYAYGEPDRYALLYEVAVTCGLRCGEVVGLRWEDVDLDKAILYVRRNVTYVDKQLFEGTPKSREQRKLSLDPGTVAVLKKHRKVQAAERLAAGAKWVNSGRVFTEPDGTGLHPHNVANRFIALVKRSGLPAMGFHGLWHSSATLGLAAGVPLRVVSERLGHSTAGITGDLYQHVTEVMDEQAAASIAGMIPRAARATR